MSTPLEKKTTYSYRILVPGEIMSPYFQNETCIPFTTETMLCTLGNLVSYSINVTGTHDVQAGVEFALKNNIRLVIKNTGHE